MNSRPPLTYYKPTARDVLLGYEFDARTILDEARAAGRPCHNSSVHIAAIHVEVLYQADVGYEYRTCYTAEPLTRLQVWRPEVQAERDSEPRLLRFTSRRGRPPAARYAGLDVPVQMALAREALHR